MRKIPACQKFQVVLAIVGVPEIFGRPGFFSFGSLEEKMLNFTKQKLKKGVKTQILSWFAFLFCEWKIRKLFWNNDLKQKLRSSGIYRIINKHPMLNSFARRSYQSWIRSLLNFATFWAKEFENFQFLAYVHDMYIK